MEKKTPLRRRDTPHHKKGKRIVITDEAKDKVLQILAQTAKKEDEEVSMLREVTLIIELYLEKFFYITKNFRPGKAQIREQSESIFFEIYSTKVHLQIR